VPDEECLCCTLMTSSPLLLTSTLSEQKTLSPGPSLLPLQQQQQQQAQQGLDLGVLKAFDLSLLRYQDRDALVETFQRYRQKVS
jgi:hypothetical protein